MHRIKDSHSGFGAIGVVIIIAVLIVGGAVGWVVYSKHTNSKPTSSSTKSADGKSSSKTTNSDPAANWVKVDSIGGGYSIRIPDGWTVTNYPGNTINTDGTTLTSGNPAIVTTATNPYAGDQKKFNVVLTDKQYTAPQWQSPNQYGTEATSDYSISSLKGKKYSIVYTQSVTGVTAGDKIHQYVFNLPSGRQLGVVYMQSAGDPDDLSTVEQAIQTIVVK